MEVRETTKEVTEIEMHWSGKASAPVHTFWGLVGVSANNTYRIVNGFQCFPLGLVLGLQLGVGVPVKFLELLNHL